MILTATEALLTVSRFQPGPDGLAAKSRELVLGLLGQTPAPFSRDQFGPGHITCTALVTHPNEPRLLLMHHHRLHRWLLPGGHVEPGDVTLAAAAAREAREETAVLLDAWFEPILIGVDVHGIPAKRDEPYHLHHDLIWRFRASSAAIEQTDEAPQVLWADALAFHSMEITESIRRAAARGGVFGPGA